MAIITVGKADDRAYIREHIELQKQLAQDSRELDFLQRQIVKKTAIRDALAARALAGLTRQNSAAATALGVFYNLQVVDDIQADTMQLLSDADADAAQGI